MFIVAQFLLALGGVTLFLIGLKFMSDNMELLAECVLKYDDFIASPYETVQHCVQEYLRGEYVFQKNRDEVLHAVWKAQIRTMYPVIEMFREDFVKRHDAAIKSQLPLIAPHGELYEIPSDVELGTLVYLDADGRLSLNDEERTRLIAFRNARNKLSHLDTLSLEEIRGLHQ